MRSRYYGIWRLFFLHYFFVSAVSQTFLSSHSLLLLGCGIGFFEMGGRESYSEASSCLSAGTVLQGSPSSLGVFCLVK